MSRDIGKVNLHAFSLMVYILHQTEEVRWKTEIGSSMHIKCLAVNLNRFKKKMEFHLVSVHPVLGKIKICHTFCILYFIRQWRAFILRYAIAAGNWLHDAGPDSKSTSAPQDIVFPKWNVKLVVIWCMYYLKLLQPIFDFEIICWI